MTEIKKQSKPLRVIEEQMLKYSDVDRDRKMTLPALARWCQDIFLKQDEMLEVSQSQNTKYGWVVLNYDLNIYKYPRFGDVVIVETYPDSFNRFYGNRIYLLKSKSGEVLAEAKTKWILIEVESMKIVRLTPEIVEIYGIHEISKGKGFEIDNVSSENFDGAVSKKLPVRYHDIDLNNHVNNTIYFSYVYDYVDREILDNYDVYKIQILFKNGITLESNPNVSAITRTEEDKQLYTYLKIEDSDTLYTTIKVLWKQKED